MIETIKGRYRQGKIELDQALDLQDGTEVVVTVTPSSGLPIEDGPLAVPEGAWAGNVPDDFEEQVYADRRRNTTQPPARW
jgi:hypothetical protein